MCVVWNVILLAQTGIFYRRFWNYIYCQFFFFGSSVNIRRWTYVHYCRSVMTQKLILTGPVMIIVNCTLHSAVLWCFVFVSGCTLRLFLVIFDGHFVELGGGDGTTTTRRQRSLSTVDERCWVLLNIVGGWCCRMVMTAEKRWSALTVVELNQFNNSRREKTAYHLLLLCPRWAAKCQPHVFGASASPCRHCLMASSWQQQQC